MDPGEAPPLRHPGPGRPIRLTETLALHYFPQLDASPFVEMEVSESVVVDDPDGLFTVMAIDANHCPGTHHRLISMTMPLLLHRDSNRCVCVCVFFCIFNRILTCSVAFNYIPSHSSLVNWFLRRKLNANLFWTTTCENNCKRGVIFD